MNNNKRILLKVPESFYAQIELLSKTNTKPTFVIDSKSGMMRISTPGSEIKHQLKLNEKPDFNVIVFHESESGNEASIIANSSNLLYRNALPVMDKAYMDHIRKKTNKENNATRKIVIE